MTLYTTMSKEILLKFTATIFANVLGLSSENE